MDLGLTDRAFVVTAASSGLGGAAAEQLVAEGARVVLVARRAEPLAKTVRRLGPDRAVALTADLTDGNTAERACALALDAFGRLDGALVSVGGPPATSVLETSEEQWRAAFESVFLAALRVSRAVVRHGTAPDLCIAWVLSTSVKTPIPGLATAAGVGHAGQTTGGRTRPRRDPGGRTHAGCHRDRARPTPRLAQGRSRGRAGKRGGADSVAAIRPAGRVRPGRSLCALTRRVLPDWLGDPG